VGRDSRKREVRKKAPVLRRGEFATFGFIPTLGGGDTQVLGTRGRRITKSNHALITHVPRVVDANLSVAEEKKAGNGGCSINNKKRTLTVVTEGKPGWG